MSHTKDRVEPALEPLLFLTHFFDVAMIATFLLTIDHMAAGDTCCWDGLTENGHIWLS